MNQWGQWQRGLIQPDYLTFVGSRPTGNVGITTSTTPPTGVASLATDGTFYLWPSSAGVNFKQTVPSTNIDNAEVAYYSNWNKWKMLVPATDRVQFGAFLDHQINDKVSAFGDFLFYRAYSRTGREPVNAKNTDDQGIYMPATNPWNPFGVRFYDPQGRPNADGTPRSDSSYRIDPSPKSHNEYKAKIKDRMITLADPGAADFSMVYNPEFIPVIRMTKVHMRMKVLPDRMCSSAPCWPIMISRTCAGPGSTVITTSLCAPISATVSTHVAPRLTRSSASAFDKLFTTIW